MNNKIKRIVSNPLFSGSIVMISGSMLINVINYAYHLIMGRVLGPEQYGALASVYSILYIVSVVPQSSSITIVKFISKAKTHGERTHIYQNVISLSKKVALLGSIILLLIAPFEQHFLNVDSLFSLIWVAPVYYFSILAIANQAALQGILSFTGVVVTNLTSSIGKLVLGLIFVFVGWAVGGAILGVALGTLFSYLITNLYIKHDFKPEEVKAKDFDIREFARYSGPVIIQALAFTSIFTLDLVLVKHFFSDHDAGLYAAISTLGKVIFFAASPITSVMFPLAARRKSSGNSSKDVFLISVLITTAVSFGITAIYFLLPEFTINLLYGHRYVGAGPLLVWMGMFISVYTISQQIVNYFLSIDVTSVVLIPLITSIVQVILIFIFHNSLLGIIQLSLSLVVISTLLLLGLLAYNHRNER